MVRMAPLKEASIATGLSQWELRTGAKAGKYPSMRIGNPKTGKLVFDLDLLESHIRNIMNKSIRQSDESIQPSNKIRVVR